MEKEIITTFVTGIVAIIGAIIAGGFTVKAAQIEATKNGTSIQSINWTNLIVFLVILIIMVFPLSFLIAFAGNLIEIPERPFSDLAGDSLDSGIVGSILFGIGFLLGSLSIRTEMGWKKIIPLALLIAVFSAPTGFFFAFLGNLMDFRPATVSEGMSAVGYIIGDSIDPFFVGGLFCGIGFIMSAKVLRHSIICV